MKLEHCDNPCSDDPFKASNYEIETTSKKEWWYVRTPGECPVNQRGEGRTIKNLDDLMKETATTSAKLILAEVIATVLYTGPMVCDYFSYFIVRQFYRDMIYIACLNLDRVLSWYNFKSGFEPNFILKTHQFVLLAVLHIQHGSPAVSRRHVQ